MRVVIPIVIIVLSSCAIKNNESTDSTEAAINSNESYQLTKAAENIQHESQKTKLIKKAEYYFKVNNIKKSSDAIEQVLLKYPAFISSSNLDFAGERIQNEITIRVQNEYFYELLKEIDKEAQFVHYRNISTSDVSKEFVDLIMFLPE